MNILKFQNWGRHTGKPEKKNQSKNHFFKDFDEFHNFGLERQSKEEVILFVSNTSVQY